jgi:glycyl-tRNA synthetase alpha chain
LKVKVQHEIHRRGLNFQQLIFELQKFWAERGCILQQPYDVEMGAGTMHPETFLRVLGRAPYRVAYVQPSRRPADGRYGENPNRLYKHTQFQVILKPAPADAQDVYLASLRAMGINLREHDIRFEEDNWESPTLGAWGIGWQVLLDGLEITQFTYFQQCGGFDLDPVSVELTYGLERIGAFLQSVDNVFDLRWSDELSYGQVRLPEELQFSHYSFTHADTKSLQKHFELYEDECKTLLNRFGFLRTQDRDGYAKAGGGIIVFPVGSPERIATNWFPILAAYDLVLKCSHLFNLLDSRGAISTTERAALIGRVRTLACRVAECWLAQREAPAEAQPSLAEKA